MAHGPCCCTAMINSVFLLNQRGEVVIFRQYRDGVPRSKADAFRKVFDGGKPMWEALAEVLDREMSAPPSKILSVGDGPGEPGCFLAARYGCPTITSDSVVPMVEAAKQRVEAKGKQDRPAKTVS